MKIPESEKGETSLPFFHSWKSVYLFVLVTFAVWVALLLALTKAFS
jgi:hypothetical protein